MIKILSKEIFLRNSFGKYQLWRSKQTTFDSRYILIFDSYVKLYLLNGNIVTYNNVFCQLIDIEIT